MSRQTFPVAPVEVGVSCVPPQEAPHLGHRALTPGDRLIDGRVFYSAAWLDRATTTSFESPALKRRNAGRQRDAAEDSSPRRAVRPASVRGVGG